MPARLLLAAALPLTLAAAPAERDWAAALRQDAQALHDDIAANHPGPLNRDDPGFSALNDRALALALQRAARTRDYAGYRFALDGYAAAFDDGHLSIGPARDAPALAGAWPGFLTAYRADGRQAVATRAADAPVPLGAVLVGCDGVPAERLAALRVGQFAGRWSLQSRRMGLGRNLFVDAGNPWVARPRVCTFQVDGAERRVTLSWRAFGPNEAGERLGAAGGRRAREPIGQRTLADGTRWITLSGFDGDPAGADAKALVPLIRALQADRAALAAAPRIVLDLRGNDGGSSDWSRQVAAVLWGQARMEAAAQSRSYAEWRASPTVLATLERYRARFDAAPDASPAMRAWARTNSAGVAGAIAAGQGLWREPEDAEPAAVSPAAMPVPLLAGRVYFVTDWGCGSACLDAADLWRALGAVQVGQETSADTLYMDVRGTVSPSGLSQWSVPMKVWRGRARGSNQPLVPVHRYDGDLADTAALERWIATLR
jgi:hypothetical protein